MSEDEDKTVDQLNDEADIAADYLEGLLDIVDYEGDIEMGIRNGRPVVQIVADDDSDIKHLIGKDGEVVNALQQLTRLAVQQRTGERSRLILDVDGFLTRKRKHIREEVLDAIDEVRETGEPVSLDAMNSFERKIVHDIVREEGLRSRSHGAEPQRYVTIYLKSQSSEDDEDDEDENYDDGEFITGLRPADEPDVRDAEDDADDVDGAEDTEDAE
ncbi:MAG: hypothetical protein PUF51_01470 [Bifidobacteriaceae bacterium]|nr:hypothetical protein [Bifidobacteriaceae bacterium]